MKIWMNPSMQNLLKREGYDFMNDSIDLPSDLIEIINSGFRTEQECVLFKDYLYFGPGDVDTSLKKTEYEEFINNITIDMYHYDINESIDSLRIGFEFSKWLDEKLRQSNMGSFRIIIQFDQDDPDIDKNASDFQCLVKFHKIRPDSDEQFKSSYLSLIENEAVLFIE